MLVTDSRLLLRATNPSSEYCVLSYSLVGRLRAVEGEDALQHDGRRHIDVERVHPGHIKCFYCALLADSKQTQMTTGCSLVAQRQQIVHEEG